nr:hypothetical protein HK105_005733 [Polyrhizophydium stewartii]
MILQLVSYSEDGAVTNMGVDLEPERFVVFVSVISADGSVDQSIIKRTTRETNIGSPVYGAPSHIQPYTSLTGSTSVAGARYSDLDRTPGIFFVFADLSVRIQGTFRLKCHLIDTQAYVP